MQKNLNIEKIALKVVQMKFLEMHITNQKWRFDIFMVGNWQNIFMEHVLNIRMISGVIEKCIILTHNMYCWLFLQIYRCCLWLLLCTRDTYISLVTTSPGREGGMEKALSFFRFVCSIISLRVLRWTDLRWIKGDSWNITLEPLIQ